MGLKETNCDTSLKVIPGSHLIPKKIRQFADTLETFRATVQVEGGELQKIYDRLKEEYDSSVREANDVRAV